MKITAIRLTRMVLPLDPPFNAAWDPEPRTSFPATLVEVETDEGVTGVGSGDTMDGFEAYEHLFIGTNPLAILNQVRRIETINFHGGRYWPLEAALWDIIGQVAGLPVATLFGGARDKLIAYASCGELKTPPARAESAIKAKERGFKAMKIRISRDHLEEGVAAVRAAREAVGGDFDLMVDLNQMWRMSGDIEPALELAKVHRLAAQLAELNVRWLEEPLPQSDVRGAQRVREQTGIQVSGGEMVRSMPEMMALIEADAYDIYQPDVALSVGMYRARQVAETANLKHRAFTPHTWSNGLGLLANLHVAAGVDAGPYLEFPYDPPGWTPERRDFFMEPLHTDADGYLRVPDRPGLGATIDYGAVEKYKI
ncbi:L-alanine-DL-glutamate epimerase-like enolase superfamily enzyme [Arthrobacter silviterrae]|uniref:Mandelate racemase/muconate lactonizing enzyme family protein n=1 Tax=Arthrobacter silviterrae TaxID=2026658 RepID=A0ABX0DCM2_9MICC|nr:mandelate racemase/muconate lactonizing enzyme family protein [Arthrobacter silviterrae]MDQ0276488.1 L-alanine-DL-glutamate epimerase-like enolase superfamily enzyme [Arthrobacter silviterrae]NGN84674.1 mandelate racemase/muconate lactonizing enzyme family protein [Arthrobacter silviterrae]